jgi:nucleoside 2-deoxyribosyltransferase
MVISMGINLYLAARCGRQEELREYAEKLKSIGVNVTARWLYLEGELSQEEAEDAEMDIEDIDNSDILVLFTDPMGSSNQGGGRYFELGYAYAMGKECIYVGESEILFLLLDDITRCETVNDLYILMEKKCSLVSSRRKKSSAQLTL